MQYGLIGTKFPIKIKIMEQLSPTLILSVIIGYFLVLIAISYFTAGKGDNKTFFTANRDSPWLLVAIGMIGASLSGVTFVSIPGLIGKDSGQYINFSYMQMVFGYLVGYTVIALVLMPIYYKYNLTSIYTYLDKKIGKSAYKTGAAFFLLSRVIGASFRLYLVSMVLDIFVTGPLGIPFFLTVVITIVLIWIYTYKGGIKTIVVTDTFQTISMLAAVGLTIYAIMNSLNANFSDMWSMISERGYTKIFYIDNGWNDANNFFKQFIGGALIAVVMTGLDQDMMQKNLTCRTLGDAQKNIFTFSIVLIFANILFLILGALLYTFAAEKGIMIPENADQLYPMIALDHLPPIVGIIFILGLIAAAYSSADSALTSLTTIFCVDFLNMDKNNMKEKDTNTRLLVHVGFSIVLLLVILAFNAYNDDSVITKLFIAANYTYGPILGLFLFSILTDRITNNSWVLPICLASPILCYIINDLSGQYIGGFQWGNMILALNGSLTFIGLMLISTPKMGTPLSTT
ncbi:MAG: Na+/proline symporter [Saprospiraceae bacterium]|jgi:Na+/proline symporter